MNKTAENAEETKSARLEAMEFRRKKLAELERKAKEMSEEEKSESTRKFLADQDAQLKDFQDDSGRYQDDD
eukprot:CAMPEP_0172602036 /NCGR_PEP_ID=MMETSP1068-20121228/22233_1 /TAXON_ID=35684 /ORGANISM="Pseudopedinella elastica, Strain CCMP716" /LENGTH=70 /DNA_ID=CAMNT_0013403267 /DNA_START=387 /DNA_END=599 /DNA_ORIENTATION=+